MSLQLRNILKSSCSLLKVTRDFTTATNLLRQDLNSNQSHVKETWDLLSAVCIERKPLITRELNALEQKFQDLLCEIELEGSLKSDHELRCIADEVRAQKMKEGSLNADMIDDALLQTGQDFVDMGLAKLKQFKPADRVTKADKENNVKSLERKLDRHLVLLLNEKLGDQFYWVMPSTKRKNDETMRQAAERSLVEKIDNCLGVRFYGNAPCGFYKYKYPKHLKNESKTVGAKIFFFKAQYLEGNLTNKKVEYTWASREELSKLLNENYNKSVRLFLIDE